MKHKINISVEEIWEDYLDFLMDYCGFGNIFKHLNKRDLEKYNWIFHILHNKNFRFIIERDDNRAWDGIKYRDIYVENNIFIKDLKEVNIFMNKDCSVMEMLIGLAIRIENEYIGDPSDEHPEDLFFIMISNLGLLDAEDNFEVNFIIDKWLDRRFTKTGKGSPFPVKKDKRDQRKLEIWDQIISYINENFIIL